MDRGGDHEAEACTAGYQRVERELRMRFDIGVVLDEERRTGRPGAHLDHCGTPVAGELVALAPYRAVLVFVDVVHGDAGCVEAMVETGRSGGANKVEISATKGKEDYECRVIAPTRKGEETRTGRMEGEMTSRKTKASV